ncbi:MAG: ABC transporter permease [Thaumarchaeota archaeon]|nr:ABC transporter permease [Nitrososphaerota archaeon]
MIAETMALTFRALKKWIRNPAAVLPGLFTSIFYLALFGSSFNPANLIPSGFSSTQISQTFGGAPTYITYLTAGVICLILVFNMAFGGIDLVLDRQLGFLNTVLTAPIPRAAIFFSGVAQNLVKVMFLAFLTFLIALVIPNGLVLPAGFGVLNLIGVFGSFALLGLGLSCVFTALALSVRSIDSLVAIVNFLTLPLIFMSDALFPSSSFPDWLKTIANVNPITKADEAARLLIVNGNLTSSQLSTFANDVLYLVGVVAILTIIGYFAAEKALSAQ